MPVEKWSESVVVVRLGNDPQFSDDLAALEQTVAHGKMDAVLDLSGVNYINSSNIARLLKVRQVMVAADARLVLTGISTQIWGAFLVTGLDKVFEFSDSVASALASLQMA